MADDSLLLIDAVHEQHSGRRPGRSVRFTNREGQGSLLFMIRYELGQLTDPTDLKSPTKLQAVAKRIVDIAMHGKDADALRAQQLLLAYFEGSPEQLVRFDFVKAVKDISERENIDPQVLIDEAEKIAAELGF